MQEFIKLDLKDEDQTIETIVRAEKFETLLRQELQSYVNDTDFQPSNCFNIDGNSIEWSPGDGGVYTIAVYAPNTPEGRTQLQSYYDLG